MFVKDKRRIDKIDTKTLIQKLITKHVYIIMLTRMVKFISNKR